LKTAPRVRQTAFGSVSPAGGSPRPLSVRPRRPPPRVFSKIQPEYKKMNGNQTPFGKVARAGKAPVAHRTHASRKPLDFLIPMHYYILVLTGWQGVRVVCWLALFLFFAKFFVFWR
jgi:hypothetical protein